MNGNRQPTPRPAARPGPVPRSPGSRAGHVLRSPKGAGGHPGVRGVTLVEMLAVIAVLGILMTVAVLGFNHFGRGVRLNTAARIIQQRLDNARELAMTRQGLYSISFVPKAEPERDFVRLQWKRDASASPEQIGQDYELPAGIEFGGNGETPPGWAIEFKSTGRAESTTLDFKIHDTDSGKERQFTVVPVTGHSEVTVP
jgi:prepilin-type N-terminal cleavage/methylation domain-containing protein